MTNHIIEVRDLTKRYGSTPAVDRLFFIVAPGRVTGFVGPNGAGKSTTMRLNVGAMLDARAVHGGRTAHRHPLALAASNGIPRRRVARVLDLVSLSRVAGRRIRGFSIGMSRRVGIAALSVPLPGQLAPWAGFVVFAAATAVVLGAEYAAFARRDA